MDRKRQRKTDFIHQLLHANFTDHYDSDESGSLCAPAQTQAVIWSLKDRDWKIDIKIEIFLYPIWSQKFKIPTYLYKGHKNHNNNR